MSEFQKRYESRVVGNLTLAINLLKLELQTKLEKQGHGRKQTSKLISGIETEVRVMAFGAVADLFLEDYYIFLEKGVSASKIPFNPGSGRRTSKYIEALKMFFRRKGLGTKEAKRAAFATANKHKKEGMPTRASFRFSTDGTRLNFFSSTLNELEDKLIELITDGVNESVELAFNAIFDDAVKKFDFTFVG